MVLNSAYLPTPELRMEQQPSQLLYMQLYTNKRGFPVLHSIGGNLIIDTKFRSARIGRGHLGLCIEGLSQGSAERERERERWSRVKVTIITTSIGK